MKAKTTATTILIESPDGTKFKFEHANGEAFRVELEGVNEADFVTYSTVWECRYCEGRLEDETLLDNHVRTCLKHPMREVESLLREAQDVVRTASNGHKSYAPNAVYADVMFNREHIDSLARRIDAALAQQTSKEVI